MDYQYDEIGGNSPVGLAIGDLEARGARITEVRATVLSVPLPRPVAWSTVRVESRDYVLVWIEDDAGRVGVGFTLGSRFRNGGRFIKFAIDELLAPVLLGRDPVTTERLWEDMAFQTLLLGRRGAVMRAISAVDIALWDLRAKAVGLPLCDLLGRHRSSVPAYASGGYYYSDDVNEEIAGLEDEIRRHVELGFKAVKIKIGRFPPLKERERLSRALEAAGPEVRVAVDANNAWRDAPSAIADLRHIDELGLWWIEEPVLPDQLDASAAIAKALQTPVATGEIEASRWGFQQIVATGAASILQPDATVVGGISEWLKVAHHAACLDIPLAPHWVPDIHVHLGASTPNVRVLEYFHPDVGVLNFNELLIEPLRVEDGQVFVPDRPGHGVLFNDEAIRRYEVA
jgi:D-arabinonate dehydratase